MSLSNETFFQFFMKIFRRAIACTFFYCFLIPLFYFWNGNSYPLEIVSKIILGGLFLPYYLKATTGDDNLILFVLNSIGAFGMWMIWLTIFGRILCPLTYTDD